MKKAYKYKEMSRSKINKKNGSHARKLFKFKEHTFYYTEYKIKEQILLLRF